MKSKVLKILIILSVSAILGCSSATKWPEFSGFLKDYKRMHRSPEFEEFFIIRHSDKRVTDYSQFMIDPVVVYLTPNADAYNANPDKLKRIALKFHSQIKDALGARYAVVNSPGKGVLRLRVAITDVFNVKSRDPKGLLEVEFIDTHTKKPVAAIIATDKGFVFSEFAIFLKNKLSELTRGIKVYTTE